MSRDHTKLRVFHDAHQLTLTIYQQTRDFPRDEWFGLRSQLRRSAVSIPCNVVEGNARPTTRDYVHFLHIALASACELQYLIGLSTELGYWPASYGPEAGERCNRVVKQLVRLVQRMEPASDRRP